ncbi:MAG: CsbD family protein [Nitrococcus sp.]|nr:CsbD family protein [Nitrococcus sp.]
MYLNTNVDETKPFKTVTTGLWHILLGKLQQDWGVLRSDNADLMDGYEEELAGRLQRFYGISKAEADRRINNWVH